MPIEWKRRVVVSAALLSGLLLTDGAIAFAQEAGSASPDTQIAAAKAWAFPVFPSHVSKPDPDEVLHVAGSARSYHKSQVILFNPPDWFPQDHPSMSQIVAHGRKPAWACGYCHMPDGQGDTATAPLAGLSKPYILEQIEAFRRGERGNGGLPQTEHLMALEARELSAADPAATT